MAHLVKNIWLRKRLKRSPLFKRLILGVDEAALIAFWTLCGWLPPERASRLGAAVLSVVGPWTSKHEKFEDNVAVAFPALGKTERQRIVKSIWRNMGACAGEYPHLGALSVAAEGEGVGIVTAIPPHLEPNFNGERRTVFATGHIANWEILAGAPRLWGLDLAVVYAPIGEGIGDKRLRQYREAMGSRLLPRDRSAKTLLAHLRSGHPIGIVADHRLDEGAELPFFSKTKATTLSPARLALKAQADLVAVRVERLGPARFRLSAEGPLTAPPEIDDEREQSLAMMTAFNKCLERWIRERPGEWICGKRSFGKEWFREFRQRRKGRVTAPGIAGARR